MLTLPTAYISEKALVHNLKQVRAFAPNSRIMAMVKADAYGHGLCHVASILEKHGADALGVARLDEGIQLRQYGIQCPIVLLSGALDHDELTQALSYQLNLVIHHPEQIRLFQNNNTHVNVWLKINTGMNRLGLSLQDASTVYDEVIKMPHLKLQGIMSHFAGSEEPGGQSLLEQVKHFENLTKSWPYPKSLANSGAIVDYPQTHLDWVRPGIMLYGISPFADKIGSELGLMPVMQLVAPLIAVSWAARGDKVGYNGIYTCPENMPYGIVRIGYGDGYPRYIRHEAFVMVDNALVPVIGRVSMDLIAIDLRGHELLPLGTPVELWGPNVPVEQLAKACETSPYELVAGLTARVLHK